MSRMVKAADRIVTMLEQLKPDFAGSHSLWNDLVANATVVRDSISRGVVAENPERSTIEDASIRFLRDSYQRQRDYIEHQRGYIQSLRDREKRQIDQNQSLRNENQSLRDQNQLLNAKVVNLMIENQLLRAEIETLKPARVDGFESVLRHVAAKGWPARHSSSYYSIDSPFLGITLILRKKEMVIYPRLYNQILGDGWHRVWSEDPFLGPLVECYTKGSERVVGFRPTIRGRPDYQKMIEIFDRMAELRHQPGGGG